MPYPNWDLIRKKVADVRYNTVSRNSANPASFRTSWPGGWRPMARFRNPLVHGYGEVDDRRMLRMFRENLADLDEYVAALRRLLPPEGG